MITDENQLEIVLTTPSPEDVEAMRAIEDPLLVVGAGGRMGPALALRARLALDAAGNPARVIGVSRFGDVALREKLHRRGVETLAVDLLEPGAVERLPHSPNVLYLVARRTGMGLDPGLSWAVNAGVAGRAAARYRESRIVLVSSGNVYPYVPIDTGGANERTPTDPVGEYAQSMRARERMFEFSGAASVFLRVNHATELRYGVLVDIARKVAADEPVDLRMGYLNVIWQGEVNSVALRAFARCEAPPFLLNVSGPGTLRVRDIALELGKRMQRKVRFRDLEANSALLSDATRCGLLFGKPKVGLDEMLEWVAAWVRSGARTPGAGPR